MSKHTRSTPAESDLLTIREAASLLRVNENTMRCWIRDGLLEAVQLPRRGDRISWRVKRAAIDAIIAGPSTLVLDDGHLVAQETREGALLARNE